MSFRNRLMAAALLALAVATPAAANRCPWGMHYEELYREELGDETIIHYRCVDRGCEARADRESETLGKQCDALRERILALPSIEERLREVTQEQLHRAQEDLKEEALGVLEELKEALMVTAIEESVREALQHDLNVMRLLIRRGVDLRQLARIAGRASGLLEAIHLGALAFHGHLTWASLNRLIQAGTDAELLEAMLRTKELSLASQLSVCSEKLQEVRDRKRTCSFRE